MSGDSDGDFGGIGDGGAFGGLGGLDQDTINDAADLTGGGLHDAGGAYGGIGPMDPGTVNSAVGLTGGPDESDGNSVLGWMRRYFPQSAEDWGMMLLGTMGMLPGAVFANVANEYGVPESEGWRAEHQANAEGAFGSDNPSDHGGNWQADVPRPKPEGAPAEAVAPAAPPPKPEPVMARYVPPTHAANQKTTLLPQTVVDAAAKDEALDELIRKKRQEEADRIKAKTGRASTIITSPLGATEPPVIKRVTLLGK